MNDVQPDQEGTADAPSWKSVRSPDEHSDFPGQMLVTRDQRTIAEWARARGASPVVVDTDRGDRLDALALDFPGRAAPTEGRTASWNEWLRIFTTSDLRFVFQEDTNDGEVSQYYRLDPSSREEGTGRKLAD